MADEEIMPGTLAIVVGNGDVSASGSGLEIKNTTGEEVRFLDHNHIAIDVPTDGSGYARHANVDQPMKVGVMAFVRYFDRAIGAYIPLPRMLQEELFESGDATPQLQLNSDGSLAPQT